MTKLLATYGTLMRAYDVQEQIGVDGQIVFEDTCRIPGVLFDFGRFPGAVPPSEAPSSTGAPSGDDRPVVHGELFRLTHPRTLTVLDRYEGYDPDRESRSLFVRRPVDLIAPAETTAWVYWYNGDPSEGQRIPSGDWQNA